MRPPTILEKIGNERRGDVEALKQKETLAALIARAKQTPAAGGAFRAALAEPGLSLIAEVKRASPSRGRIADIPEPVELAQLYRDAGARACSVLTEPRHFLGSESDLKAVAAASGLPVIRKDFLIDPYMIWEARAWGASAVLLIVAMLPSVQELRAMLEVCREAEVDALVEIHDEQELLVALEAGAEIIGVNHRNLHDFSIDLSLFERLQPQMPEGVICVAESGLKTRSDVARMEASGADAILVGEQLSSAADPREAARELLGKHA